MAHASFAEWGGRVAVNWMEIAAIFSLAAFCEHWLGYLAALLMLGTRQHALAILGHDGAHRFASQHKKINDLTTCLLVFWPLGVGLDGYRQFHYRHHRRAGKPEDPEMDIKNMSPREWRKPLSRRRMLGLVLRDLSGFALRDIYRLVKVIRPVTFRDWLGPLLWWSVAGVAAYEFEAFWAVALWWLAIISSYWAVFRMRAWSEHFDTPRTYRISANWWQKMIFCRITPGAISNITNGRACHAGICLRRARLIVAPPLFRSVSYCIASASRASVSRSRIQRIFKAAYTTWAIAASVPSTI